jgi:hypothetical protein
VQVERSLRRWSKDQEPQVDEGRIGNPHDAEGQFH